MRLVHIIRLILLSLAFLLCISSFTYSQQYILKNKSLKITFADESSGFDCISIENTLVSNTRFVVPSKDEMSWAGLWTMTFSCPSINKGARELLHINNRASGGVKTAKLIKQSSSTELVLKWNGVTLGDEPGCLDVTATISLASGNAPSNWRIAIDNRSKKWGIDSLCYPFLRTICKKGTADVLLPTGAFGGTLNHNNTSAYDGFYPYWECAVQFMAFNQGNAGLYVAAHDGEENTKKLKLMNDQHVTFEVYAADTGIAGSARIPSFPIVISAYNGNWWQASKIYRKWAIQQKWMRKGWLAKRTDVPQRFLDIGFWLQGQAVPQEWLSAKTIRSDMTDAQKFFSPLKLALHWYDWHEIPFDSEYPEFFPPKKGAAEDIKHFETNGLSIMPYINAHLWDTGLPNFNTEGRPAAIKSQDGVLNAGPAATPGRELAVMCPYTQSWQNKITGISKRLIDELGVTGIYLDQLGGTRAKPCFDPSHGHPLGGGNFWTEGYRQMADSVRKVASPNHVYLTSEMFAEQFIDEIDGFLIAHLYRHENDVPLIQAVYSGYTTYFGCLESSRDSQDTFAALQGTSFIWGLQPGWLKVGFLKQKEKADLAKKLALYRMAAKDFLIYGELVDEVHITPEPDKLSATIYGFFAEISAYNTRFPTVRGSLWRSYDGKSLGIVLMNMDSKPHKASFSVDINHWLKRSKNKLGIYRIQPEGTKLEQEVNSGLLTRDITLDAREVLVLAVKPLIKAAASESYAFDREMSKRKLDIHLKDSLLKSLYSSNVEVTLEIVNNGTSSQKLQISWPDNVIESVSLNPKQARTLKHKLQTTKNPAMYEKFEIGIKYGNLQKRIPLYVNLIPPLELAIGEESLVSPNQPPGLHPGGDVTAIEGDRVTPINVTVRNNTSTMQSGDVKMELPDNWLHTFGGSFIGLHPGKQESLPITCRIPAYPKPTLETVRAIINQDTVSKTVTIVQPRARITAGFIDKAPVIDGHLDDWTTPVLKLDSNSKTNIKISDYTGDSDLSATVYTGWDKDNFYFACKVVDDIFCQENSNELMWNGDCIQLNFLAKPRDSFQDFAGETAIGLTLLHGKPFVYRWTPNQGVFTQPELSVVRNDSDKTTTYEARIPWKSIDLDVDTPITWSFTINDRDGKDEPFGWMEWTPGICGIQDTSAFGWLELKK